VRRYFIAVVFLMLAGASAGAADPSEKPWKVYAMKRVQIRDEPGMPFVYVIGYSAFRTAQALKDWVALIPEGDTLQWDPSGDIPVLGDPLGAPEAAEDFKKFCEVRRIKLVVVPRP